MATAPQTALSVALAETTVLPAEVAATRPSSASAPATLTEL